MCEPIQKSTAFHHSLRETKAKTTMPDEVDENSNAAWKERIERNPDILFGKPVIKGTRLAVDLIIDLLSWGWSESDIMENYPGVTHEDIKACLSYAGAALRRCCSLRVELNQ